ncbi:MAG TPA: polyphenol oxidase family protein [Acidimicrobiales bacterium]|nr:polyphenol oxidase family protein [Acidimicrobiales bacterium]
MHAAWSDATWGDLRPSTVETHPGAGLEEWTAHVTRAVVGPTPVRQVRWMDQVHGSTVLVSAAGGPRGPLPSPGREVEAVPAGSCDGLVSADPSVAVSVLTADCASIALGSPEGVFGAVHAGWRGLAGGVVEAAVAAMRATGATEVVGALGPCIHAGCYEFSEGDLGHLAGAYGQGVVGRTTAGRPALDLRATVSAALVAGGATETVGIDACTACAGGYFSHRARRDSGRQAMIVWSEGGAGG